MLINNEKNLYKIKNENLILVSLKSEHIEQVRKLRNYWNQLGRFIDSNMISTDQQKKWYESYKLKKDDLMYVIFYHGFFVGTIAVYNINPSNRSCEFGRLMIIPEYCNKNIAFNSSITLLDWGIKELKIKYFYLEVFLENKVAIKLYKSIGFKEKITKGKMLIMELYV
ncbi:MAG: GNAT family N-acetyltransferase [Clostridiaceae bacterium]